MNADEFEDYYWIVSGLYLDMFFNTLLYLINRYNIGVCR